MAGFVLPPVEHDGGGGGCEDEGVELPAVDELVVCDPIPVSTQSSVPTARARAPTASTRAVGKPRRRTSIPCACRRRVNQSSRPSSLRGGSNCGGAGSVSRVSSVSSFERKR